MIVVYTPEGGEPEHYDASSLKVSEAAIVQRTVDMKWQEILAGLEQDDLDAMRGIVWVIKKRSQPALRFGEFDPGVTEMTSRMDNKEIQRWLDATLDAIDPELDWETIEGIIGPRLAEVAVDPEYARQLLDARATVPKEVEDSGPQPEETPDDSPSLSPTSSTPETSTSDSSLTSSTSHPETSMT
ncbi:hypothetical protein ACIBQ5_05310 [Streptomyces massasporeus]|uniref:hypothetical protein n=1 Tax=Streptomyces massasporeus TaxID=67324 RepID=UPI0037B78218